MDKFQKLWAFCVTGVFGALIYQCGKDDGIREGLAVGFVAGHECQDGEHCEHHQEVKEES